VVPMQDRVRDDFVQCLRRIMHWLQARWTKASNLADDALRLFDGALDEGIDASLNSERIANQRLTRASSPRGRIPVHLDPAPLRKQRLGLVREQHDSRDRRLVIDYSLLLT